jgi:hypothetical protein
MPSEKSDPPFILDDLLRSQLDPTDIDLEWLQSVKVDAEQVIEAFRGDRNFASALPAFSVWPELMWRED